MKAIVIAMSLATMMAMTSCTDNSVAQEKKAYDAQARQERAMVTEAIQTQSPDFQQVELIGDKVVYTHIYDGIIDITTYTYDGDTCTAAERVYIYPTQMSALRHFRRAMEYIQLYNDIKLINNEVRCSLKAEQHELETKGLTKEQLKTKFENQIKAARADFDKVKNDCKKDCKNDCQKDCKKACK